MEKPLIDAKAWEKAVALNDTLKEAVMNPNTYFMTKLLFDSRFFAKKTGKEVPYWSNSIFKLKLALHEKKALGEKPLAKAVGIGSAELKELLSYLKNMGEITEAGGKISLNYANPFSKVFAEK